MSLTDVLAIVGAVTGMTGSALGVMAYRRDRAKVRLALEAGQSVLLKTAGRDLFLLKIELHNAGRQPTTLQRVSMVRSRHRGLVRVLPLARYRWVRWIIERLWRVTQTGDAFSDRLSLAANETVDHTVKAEEFADEAERKGHGYVYAIGTSGAFVGKRIDTQRDVTKWGDWDAA